MTSNTVQVGVKCIRTSRIVFDVTYSNSWRTCPDGHEHVYNDVKVCNRCDFSAPYNPD